MPTYADLEALAQEVLDEQMEKEAADYQRQERRHRFLAPHHENERRGQETGRTWGARIGAPAGAATTTGGVLRSLKGLGLSEAGAKGKLLAAGIVAGSALAGGASGSVIGRGIGGATGRSIGVMRGEPKRKEKRSSVSAFETLAQMRALEILAENGIELE
jgi:hypothetical protein